MNIITIPSSSALFFTVYSIDNIITHEGNILNIIYILVASDQQGVGSKQQGSFLTSFLQNIQGWKSCSIFFSVLSILYSLSKVHEKLESGKHKSWHCCWEKFHFVFLWLWLCLHNTLMPDRVYGEKRFEIVAPVQCLLPPPTLPYVPILTISCAYHLPCMHVWVKNVFVTKRLKKNTRIAHMRITQYFSSQIACTLPLCNIVRTCSLTLHTYVYIMEYWFFCNFVHFF